MNTKLVISFIILINSFLIIAENSDEEYYEEEDPDKVDSDDYDYSTTELITKSVHFDENLLNRFETNNQKNDVLSDNQIIHQKINQKLFGNLDFEKLLKIKIINETVNKAKQKMANFSIGVKQNLRSFISESNQGLSPDMKDMLKNKFLQFIESLELSKYCLISFALMKDSLVKGEMWPIRFLDSMEFVASGIMDAKFTSFGEFDECLDIESKPINSFKIQGQYCMAKLPLSFINPSSDSKHTNVNNTKKIGDQVYKLDANLKKLMQAVNLFKKYSFRIGLCIPHTCNPKEIENALNKILRPLRENLVEIESDCSYKNKPQKINAYQRISISIFMTLIVLVIISTTFEVYYLYKRRSFGRKKTIKKSLLIFSVISNTRRLFERDNNRLKSVDTILLFLITMEFWGRSYVMPIFHSMIGLRRANTGLTKEFFSAKKFFWIRNNSYAMSIYILMGGIIIAYNLVGIKRNNRYNALSYFRYLVNRYLSFSRRIIGPILLLYLIPLYGEGPLWHYFEQIHVQPCKQYLIRSLLFFNNYADSFDKLCNLPSATLSGLFQLQLLAPILLLSLKFKRIGYAFMAVLVLIGCYLSVLRKLFFGLPIAPFEVSTMTSVPSITHSFIHYMSSTEQNISVFIIGLLWGYFIRTKPDVKTGGRIQTIIVWTVMLSFAPIASYWSETFKALKGDFSQISFLLWFFSGRVMWALTYGWVVYACSTGKAGVLNKILSVEFLQPLARLSFGIYLNHLYIISFRAFKQKETYILNHSDIFENVFVDYVRAIIIAYFLFVLIESPAYHLIKIVSNTETDTKRRVDVNEENNRNSRNLSESIEIKIFNPKS